MTLPTPRRTSNCMHGHAGAGPADWRASGSLQRRAGNLDFGQCRPTGKFSWTGTAPASSRVLDVIAWSKELKFAAAVEISIRISAPRPINYRSNRRAAQMSLPSGSVSGPDARRACAFLNPAPCGGERESCQLSMFGHTLLSVRTNQAPAPKVKALK